MNNAIGTIYDNDMPTVIVHQGLRGARGLPGEEGDQGEQGDSINLRGEWQSGATYAALDAVTWRSSLMDGVDSLYIQISAWPTEVSTIEPQDDPARWAEVGQTGEESLLGSVWVVEQAGHPFSKVGQPAALTASGYHLASADDPARVAIAMVREIIDANSFILQSSGGIKNVDPSVVLGPLVDSDFYYVAPTAGYIQPDAPTGVGQLVHTIYQHGPDPDGVVLPWTPAANELTVYAVRSTTDRFYYFASAGQTDFTGADINGNTPDFSSGEDVVECYQNGLNLWESDYTVDPTTLMLLVPAALNDRIEIHVTEPIPPSPTGRVKLDPLPPFDGVTTDFPLLLATAPIAYLDAQFFDVYLDANPQEPFVDFVIADVGGEAQISFSFAPEQDTENWIIRDTG